MGLKDLLGRGRTRMPSKELEATTMAGAFYLDAEASVSEPNRRRGTPDVTGMRQHPGVRKALTKGGRTLGLWLGLLTFILCSKAPQ